MIWSSVTELQPYLTSPSCLKAFAHTDTFPVSLVVGTFSFSTSVYMLSQQDLFHPLISFLK